MKQPHSEDALDHTDGEQDTGNHQAPNAPAHVPGGTRIGAENVEKTEQKTTNIGQGPDVDKVAGLEERLDESVSVNGPTERAP